MELSTVFEFASPARIIFGEGALQQAGKIAATYGSRGLVVTGLGSAATTRLFALLRDEGIELLSVEVSGEPEISSLTNQIQAARTFDPHVVIGFGGGSSLDTAKAISAMLTNPGELTDYLEVIGKGKVMMNVAAPCIAIPTTAGTGSEVTRNAVIGAPERQMKVSMRSVRLLPQVALVDPELTYTLPPAITAATGMDAIAQVLEPYVSARANRMTDMFCREALQVGPQALYQAFQDGQNREARKMMSWTSLLGGLALANAGLGAVHGFASPIGGMFNIPHGVVCARLLVPVMTANINALRQRSPFSPALTRYAEAACWMTGNAEARIEDGIDWLEQITESMAIPRLSHYGIGEQHVPAIVEKATIASSMKANPIRLTDLELASILQAAI